MPTSLDGFVESFPWESEAQRKGFLALVMFMRRENQFPKLMFDPTVFSVAAWFIQRDHESDEWYNQRIGDLSTRVDDDLKSLMDENRALRGEIEELKAAVAKLVGREP